MYYVLSSRSYGLKMRTHTLTRKFVQSSEIGRACDDDDKKGGKRKMVNEHVSELCVHMLRAAAATAATLNNYTDAITVYIKREQARKNVKKQNQNANVPSAAAQTNKKK